MTALTEAIDAWACREFRKCHLAWSKVRDGGHATIIPDLMRFETAAKVGDVALVEQLQPAYADIATSSKEIAESFRVIEILKSRRNALPELPDGADEDAVRIHGRRLIEARLLTDAKELWRRVQESNPKDGEAIKRLAQIAEWNGDWDEVADLASIGLALAPDSDLSRMKELADGLTPRRKEPASENLRRFKSHPLLALVSQLGADDPRAVALRNELEALNLENSQKAAETRIPVAVESRPAPSVAQTEATENAADTSAHQLRSAFPSPLPDEDRTPFDAEHTRLSPNVNLIRSTRIPTLFLLLDKGVVAEETEEDSILLRPASGATLLIDVSSAPVNADRVVVELPVSGDFNSKSVDAKLARWTDSGLEFRDRQLALSLSNGTLTISVFPNELAWVVQATSTTGRYCAVEICSSAPVKIGVPTVAAAAFDKVAGPYRFSDHGTMKALATHNDKLRRGGTLALDEWLIEEARLAVKLDCIETAAELIQLLRKSFPPTHLSRSVAYLRVATDVAFAIGAGPAMLEELIMSIDLVLGDDALFASLSALLSQAGQNTDRFHRLPSGAPNNFLLAHASVGEILAHAQEAPDPLLLANAALGLGPCAHLKAFNTWLLNHGLTGYQAPNHTGSFLARIMPDELSNPVPQEQPASVDGDPSLVSIIIAAFNAGETISYALRSILDQDYPDVEVLVCDDGSQDNTWRELLKYKSHPRLRLFKSKKNQGPYNIRNALLAEARGAYVGFHDADDLSHLSRVRKQVEKLTADECAAVICHGVRVTPEGRFVFFRDHRCERQSTISMIAKKEVFNEVGSYRPALCGADSDYLERIRLRYGHRTIGIVPVPMVYSLWSDTSMTRQEAFLAAADSFKSPGRRAFAETATRQRVLGVSVVPNSTVERVLAETGIFRSPSGVEAITAGEKLKRAK